MTREEKFIELGKLYAEINRLTNRVMELIDSPSAEQEFEKAIVDHKQKEARKTKKRGRKAGGKRASAERTYPPEYRCEECSARFESDEDYKDVRCIDCGSSKVIKLP